MKRGRDYHHPDNIEAVWKNINGDKRKRTEIFWMKIKIKIKGDGGNNIKFYGTSFFL